MPSRDDPIRIRFGWDGIEKITVCEAVSWEPLDEFEEAWIHPKEFYMTSEERFLQAIEDIEDELDERVNFYERKGLDLEAHRIEQRKKFDLECYALGSCKGVKVLDALRWRQPGSDHTVCDFDSPVISWWWGEISGNG